MVNIQYYKDRIKGNSGTGVASLVQQLMKKQSSSRPWL